MIQPQKFDDFFFALSMWLVRNPCALHRQVKADHEAPGPIALLTPLISPCRDGALLLTTDRSAVACDACSARPFTVLCAEKFGLRSTPPIPKKVILSLEECLQLECILESLDKASSLDDFDLLTHHYPGKKEIRRYGVSWQGRQLQKNAVFSPVADVDHALRGLRRRLEHSGLDPETFVKAELSSFPLLFWHVCQLNRNMAEDDALIVATRILSHLGRMSGKELPLPPFDGMPKRIQNTVTELFDEVQERRKKDAEKKSEVCAQTLAELKKCAEVLGLRQEVEAFDRSAYLDWGDARSRPCCTFHFMDVRGCDTCEAAFAKGRKLNALKMNMPDWEALSLKKSELEDELQFLRFEGVL